MRFSRIAVWSQVNGLECYSLNQQMRKVLITVAALYSDPSEPVTSRWLSTSWLLL
jgi:hypothetical protein